MARSRAIPQPPPSFPQPSPILHSGEGAQSSCSLERGDQSSNHHVVWREEDQLSCRLESPSSPGIVLNGLGVVGLVICTTHLFISPTIQNHRFVFNIDAVQQHAFNILIYLFHSNSLIADINFTLFYFLLLS